MVECDAEDITNPGMVGVFYKIQETLGDSISEYDKTVQIDGYDLDSSISDFYTYCVERIEELEGIDGE
jgi:hypothetical protein